jgi:arginase
MRLAAGAQAIRADLPTSSTMTVAVPLEAGDDLGSGIDRLSSIRAVRDAQAVALAGVADWALTIGGDCGVELGSVGHVAARDDVALVWFDAHADLNTAASSPSGAFHGMVVRTLLGDGDPSLVPATPLPTNRVLLAGTRAVDDAEASYLAESGVQSLPAAELTCESLIAAIEASGASSVYIHIDLDVLDPAEIQGIGYPEPFGLTVPQLTEMVRAVKARFTLVGAGITEFAPADDDQASDDLPTILRLIGALTR